MAFFSKARRQIDALMSIRTEHRGVFDQQIYEFFQDDINSCLAVSKIKQSTPAQLNFPGGLNFTAALAILSVIEMMSAYYAGVTENDGGKLLPASAGQVANFMVKYFGKYYTKFQDVNYCKEFFKIFRHGLSHQWSPKRSGVAMDFYSSAIIVVQKNTEGNDVPFLNIPPFFEITMKALKDYDQDLQGGEHIDEFIKHLEAIQRVDDTEIQTFLSIEGRS